MSDTRRDRGSGGISQRKDGTWTARVNVGKKENGKPYIKAFYGKSEAEVKRKMKEFIAEKNQNKDVVVKKTTVSEYMTRWLEEVKSNDLKPKSYDRLEQTITNQITPYIGHLQVGALRPSDVQDMVNDLKKKGLSYSSIKKAYNAVNGCFNAGVIQRTVTFNPAAGVVLPRQELFEQEEVHYYTLDEVRAISAAATARWGNGTRKYRLGSSVVLLLNTGLRTAEFAGLKWRNVDLKKRVLHIIDTRVVVKNRDDEGNKYKTITQRSSKSKSSRRTVPLNDAAVAALLDLQEVTGSFEYVYSSRNGDPLTIRTLDKLLRNVVRAAGLPQSKEYGPHALRHTFASILFDRGTDIKTISKLLGHADVNITYKVYIHLIEEMDKMNTAVRELGNVYD